MGSKNYGFGRVALSALLLVGGVALSGNAQAEGAWGSTVPNGNVNSCDTCHGSVPALNSFGDDVAATLSGGEPDWAAVWDLDSDGDGQTNGEELGDPCGDWTLGATPGRTTDISNPGDNGDTSADPNNPTCGAGGGGAGGSGTGGTGTGATGAGGTGTGGTGTGGTGTGGTPTGTATGTATGAPPPPAGDTEDDGGCALRSPAGSSGLAGLGLLAALSMLGLRRRRS